MIDEPEELNSLQCEILDDVPLNVDYTNKMIIIGSSAAGKSTLLLRCTRNLFKDNYEVTMIPEFGTLTLKIGQSIIKTHIWDTAGSEAYKSVTKIFYKGSQCAFLVYDITQESSFLGAQKWLKELRNNADPNLKIYLVGNKIDLDSQRVIKYENGFQFASGEKLDGFMETSAKSGENVQKLFIDAVKRIYIDKMKIKNSNFKNELIKISVKSNSKQSSCC